MTRIPGSEVEYVQLRDTEPIPQQTTSDFSFGDSSRKHLSEVHPHLVRLAERALELSPIDFSIIDGLRTMAEQREYVRTGASKTLNSRHLTGHAVDFAPWINGRIRWEPEPFKPIVRAFILASDELSIPMRSGWDWDRDRDFGEPGEYDMGHVELWREEYPA